MIMVSQVSQRFSKGRAGPAGVFVPCWLSANGDTGTSEKRKAISVLVIKNER
jgi:hypothetical protein